MSNKKVLPFNSIYDLLSKVEKIRLAHELVNKLYKQTLLDNGVPFTEIGDLGVMIDIGKVPEEKKHFINNPFKEMFEVVYEQTGVIDYTNPIQQTK